MCRHGSGAVMRGPILRMGLEIDFDLVAQGQVSPAGIDKDE